MPSIDERVVEMTFDRADFLKGTEETLNSLQRLEEAILGSGGIAEGVNAIERTFTTVGKIGVGALAKIGSMAVETGNRLFKSVLDPLMTGGKRRTQNLAQANFMLSNLVKDGSGKTDAAAVAAIMKQVNASVDGTAYGLDEAAVAAAQFAATGMRAGENLEKTLSGIVGVAAMGGAEYSRVADIFVKVSGQGRVMGDDLNRVSALGINAAQTITDYLNRTREGAKLTEGEVRKMVSEGKISFATFSAALGDAFGDSASKANDLFTGAASNFKSAFARIGQLYYDVELEKLRRVFNALRPAVNVFKDALVPVAGIYRDLVAMPMAEWVERQAASFTKWAKEAGGVEKISRLFTELANTVLAFSNFATSWLKPVGDAFASVFLSMDPNEVLDDASDGLQKLQRGLEKISASDSTASKIFDGFSKIFEIVKSVASFVSGVLSASFSFLGDVFAKVFDIGKKGIDYLKLGFEQAQPVIDFLWEAIKMGVNYIREGFEFVLPYIQQFFEYLKDQIPVVKEYFRDFQQEVQNTGSFFKVLEDRFKNMIDNRIKPVVAHIEKILDAFVNLKEKGIENLEAALEGAFGSIENAAGTVKTKFWTPLTEVLNALTQPVRWLLDQLPQVGSWFLKIATENLPEFSDMVGATFELLSLMFEKVSDIFEQISKDFDAKDLNELANGISMLVLAIGGFKALKSIQGVNDAITGFFGSLSGALDRLGQESKSTSFLKIAGGIALVAGALYILSTIDPTTLWTSIAAIAAIGLVLTGMMYLLSKIDPTGLMVLSAGIFALGLAMLSLTVALVIMSTIPFGLLQQGLIIMTALMAMMTISGAVLGHFGKDLPMAALGLGMMTLALFGLVLVIERLAAMDLYQVATSLGMLVIGLYALVVAAVLISNDAEQILMGAVGIAAIAASLYILAISLEKVTTLIDNGLGVAMMAIALGLTAMVVAARALSSALSGGLAFLAMAVGIGIFAVALWLLASIPWQGIVGGLFTLAIGLTIILVAAAAAMAVAPGLAALGAALGGLGIVILAVGVALLLGAVAFTMVNAVLPSFMANLMQLAMMVPILITFADELAIIGAALLVFGAGALVAGTGAILLGAGLVAMGAGMVLISTFGKQGADALMNFMRTIEPLWKGAIKFGIIAAEITALGAALLVLGTGMALVGVGGMAMAVAIFMLTTSFVAFMAVVGIVAALSETLTAKLKLLATAAPGLLIFATAVIGVATALNQYNIRASTTRTVTSQLVSQLNIMSNRMASLAGEISQANAAVNAAMAGIVASMTSSTSKIQSASADISKSVNSLSKNITPSASSAGAVVTRAVSSIVSALSSGKGRVSSAVQEIVSAFNLLSSGIRSKVSVIISATTLIVSSMVQQLTNGRTRVSAASTNLTNVFKSMAANITSQRGSVSNAVSSLVGSIVSGLNNGRHSVMTAANSLGMAISQGMANGIRISAGSVTSQANRVANRAVTAAKATLQIKSPSRVMYGIGVNFVQGFANALYDNAENAGSSSRTVAQRAIEDMVDALDEIDDGDIFNVVPTITPVLDMDEAVRQAREFDGFASLLDPDLNTGQAAALASIEESLTSAFGSGVAGKTISYTQNNYSPKALSNAEIYRRTKNHLSAVESEEASYVGRRRG